VYQPIQRINYQALLLRMALSSGVAGFGALQLHSTIKEALYAAGVAGCLAGENYLRIPRSSTPKPPHDEPAP